MSPGPYFDVYIAWKRLRTEMWHSFPLCVFIRWLFNKHPRMVVPVAVLAFLIAMAEPVREMVSMAVNR